MEVMRDLADNVDYLLNRKPDPMGIIPATHYCAPAQTLTDKEYQTAAAIRIIREIGVETGGSNIQFAS